MAQRIGQLLLDLGIITDDQLQTILGRQRRFGGRLATNCLAMGYADETILARLLSHLQGVPFVVLSQSALPIRLLDEIPLNVARNLRALPIHRSGSELFVAMADPCNISILDELRFITGATIIEHGALDGVLKDTIEEAYRSKDTPSTQHWLGNACTPGSSIGADGHIEIVVGRDLPYYESRPAAADITQIDPNHPDSWTHQLVCLAEDIPESTPKKEPNIMVVEDDPELRRMLMSFFEKIGMQVQTAADGIEAIRSLKAKLPDALVLDAMLPGIHGFDICYRIKHSEATRHVPVVMISAVYRGWRYADDVRRLYGADHFLEKPLRLDELKHVLEKLLHQDTSHPSADVMCRQANAALHAAATAFRKGDLFSSAKHMEKAIQASPFSATLHHRLGLLYDQLDEPYRAIAEISRAVELEPNYERLLALAGLYEKTGFTFKAFESWERCLRSAQDPKEAEKIRNHMDQLLSEGLTIHFPD